MAKDRAVVTFSDREDVKAKRAALKDLVTKEVEDRDPR